MFERILVAVDHSGHSHEAARLAGLVAARFGSEVRLVHVLEAPAAARLAGGEAEALGIETRRQARALVHEEARRLVELGIAAGGRVVERPGSLSDLIKAEAARWHADLVAVGRAGESSAVGIWMPAHTLVQELQVPVLLAARREDGRQPGLEIISVAVEEAPESYQAAAVAAELARRLDAELRVVHSAEDAEAGEGSLLVERLVERMRAEGLIAWPVVRRGRVLDRLREEAEAGSRLLVTGSRSVSELRRHLAGGVSHGLLRESPLPVLFVRGRVAVPQLTPSHAHPAGGFRP